MDTELIAFIAAIVAILSTSVVYGTDVFCAVVLRPTLARMDDRTLVAVMGTVHRFGDRRMPLPGALGVVATALTAILAAVGGHWAQSIAAALALVLLLTWLMLYLRVSAPINRQLTAAADAAQTPPNGRALQAQWDRVINIRALLQGIAVGALCLTLLI